MSLPKPYYEEAGIVIYNVDCREILPHIVDFDAVVTDPPYGVEFHGKNTKHTKRTDGGYTQITDSADIVRTCVVPIITSLIGMNRRIVITPGLRNAFSYPEPDAFGVIFYPSGAGLGRWGFTCSQPIFYYGKCPYLATGQGHRPDSFSTTEASEDNGHPCPKPLGTVKWLVNKASLHGETILDPFMGSGTTLRAAKDLGRKAIGIEIEEKYCEIAVNRLRQEVLNL